jgi:hypothetical protein
MSRWNYRIIRLRSDTSRGFAVKPSQWSHATPDGDDDFVACTSKGKAMGFALLGGALLLLFVMSCLIGPTQLRSWRGSLDSGSLDIRQLAYLALGPFSF